MARDGSGTYARTQSDYVFNTVIDEAKVNSELNDIATEITNSIDKDGQTTWTGNQNAGSTKITALAVGTANTDSITLGQSQDGGMKYAAGTGTDTITMTLSPAITAYAAGQHFFFKQAGSANTGATTLNVNSVGAKSITKKGTTALAASDIPANAMVHVVYDGTQFQLMNVGTDVGITASETVTLTNKTIDLTDNTLQGTLAELNTAITDATIVDLDNADTLTNKTIDEANNTLTGVATLTGSQTLTNKTLTAPQINDPAFDVSVGNTANSNSSQGDNPITSFFYEIATCATAGDAVTLPSASAGLMVIIANNGAESADVFPASGDSIDGASVNVASSLASGTNTVFICQDGTDWDTVSGGGGGGVTASSIDTFTNKTFDANGTGNSISNIENADINSSAAIAASKLDFSSATTGSDLVISAAGEVTLPNQPNFSGGLTSTQSNVTGDGTIWVATGAIWTEYTDRNADFSNGTFTAPVGGQYVITAKVEIEGLLSGHTRFQLGIVTSNRTYASYWINPYAVSEATIFGAPTSIVCDMDAADTAHMTVTVTGSTKVIEVNSGSTFTVSLIS